MTLLRLTQHATAPDRYRAELRLESKGLAPLSASAEFEFKLTQEDWDDLRWYLEEYLQYPIEPERVVARVEERIVEIGMQLFRAVFQANDDAGDLWAVLRDRLDDTRVEISAGVRDAAAIPWELIRDPKTDTPLALRARAFVRAQSDVQQRPQLPERAASGKVRILLVICRPGRDEDVPFRSVAGRLIKGLTDAAREVFQLDVLRPPTFEQLGKTLRAAKSRGEPYHVVHFDGHGLYADVAGPEAAASVLRQLMPMLLTGPREGAHGYLAFENAALPSNMQLVDGPSLGKLLVETDVSALVLNACRSAHASPPLLAGEGPGVGVHEQIRAYGSLAQEVIDAGVPAVVAMRYNVYVVTAAQFVADLYTALASGRSLGEAVTLGRKQLAAAPLRAIAFDPIPLQDWSVPVVYEAAPIELFPKREDAERLRLSLDDGPAARGAIEPELAKRHPDAGFFGRDETLLALDRAFDTQPIVLLHAFAGSGKTTTAVEFGLWYRLTGGLAGPILFTTFERHTPLARALDAFGQTFGGALERNGVNWPALSDAQRQSVALQVMGQVPVLWIWDNVEPIAGFPAGTPSAWSEAEQRDLADFLRAARGTRARFLLTSRRDERGWLGDLPARITLPPMPMQERVQLARALAEKHGRRLIDVKDWRPLLHFTRGNPLTITVLVGQALRDGLTTRAQIEAFVERLRAGEAAFDDEASEGRSRSLGASLSYGFEHAFNADERAVLALLHFFQGFVDVGVLQAMGDSRLGDLETVRGLTREAGIALLDRAAEVGLLTAHGGGTYSIHPALPWYFKSLFEQYYSPTPTSPPSQTGERQGEGVRAARAFVEAMGELGNHYFWQYEGGSRDVIAALSAEEANLLHTRQVARANGWWPAVINAMQGLRTLYDHTGRRIEWKRLVDEIVPDFVDPATDGPLPGREDVWSLVTDYRVRLAREAREWADAERLQRRRVEWNRQRAAPALAAPVESLDAAQRNAIRSLAVSLEALGSILREQSDPACAQNYEEAIPLCQKIGDRPEEVIIAFNLGRAYMDTPALRDLDQAERWYRRSLELRDERDRLGRGRCHNQLGYVAWERFKDAHAAQRPEAELDQHLNVAAGFYHQALDLLPPNAVDDLALPHNLLGLIYMDAGDLNHALAHYRESIRYLESAGDLYHAGMARRNVALALAQANRLPDAREYALAALRNFEPYGQGVADEIQKTQTLIAMIEQRMGNG